MHAILCTLAVVLVSAFAAQTQPTTRPSPMKVMSFNIRNGGAPDGENVWPNRRELLFRTIHTFGPDLLGLQEVLHGQYTDAKTALPEYDVVGVGREDGKQKGEYAALFYRRDRFELLESGTWWLSATPEQVASVGWDAALTRTATWARLRETTSGEALLVINTHFDHVGEVARLESAKLLREKLKDVKERTVLMGDFNCTDVDDPIKAIVADGTFTDTFRKTHPEPTDNEASFHGFNGHIEGKRIDFIFTKGFEVLKADIDRTRDGKRCPSDHDAVTATIQ